MLCPLPASPTAASAPPPELPSPSDLPAGLLSLHPHTLQLSAPAVTSQDALPDLDPKSALPFPAFRDPLS